MLAVAGSTACQNNVALSPAFPMNIFNLALIAKIYLVNI
jgi:hypothetical protein